VANAPRDTLLTDLLAEVTRMSASVSTESTYGKGMLDSLSALSDDITSSLASSESLSERQQIELLEVFTDLKNTLAHQVALLSNVVLREFRETQRALEKLPDSQMAAAIVGAHLTSRWASQANDPLQIAGRRWVTMFVFLADAYRSGHAHTLEDIKDEMLTKGVPGDVAQAMLNKLVKEKVLRADGDSFRLDIDNPTYVRTASVINGGGLPML